MVCQGFGFFVFCFGVLCVGEGHSMGGGLCIVFCGIGGMLGGLPGHTCDSVVSGGLLFRVLVALVLGVLALLRCSWFGRWVLVFVGAVLV